MAEKVAIAIGVARAGSLTKLPGAVNGAREFIAWAAKQGYAPHLVTDEDEAKQVTVAGLSSLVGGIIDEGAERLLIYFAGHGIQPAVNTAYWLLSNWEANSNEAVNVNLSFSNAKRSGIKQIGIFSDACRSTVPDAASVGGSSIFPKSVASAGRQPQWDQFLASRLGEIAQEVSGSDPLKAYGIFTRCVMAALSGKAPEACELQPGPEPIRVVTSASLATYLEEHVPLESGKTPGAGVQWPEVISGWRRPADVYLEMAELSFSIDSKGLDSAGDDEQPAKSPQFSADVRKAVADAAEQADSRAANSAAIFAASEGRASFETGQGLTIVGADPRTIKLREGEAANLFDEGGAFHVRGFGSKPQPIMIELENGNWVGTCIFPEFVGTIIVKDGLATALNYVPIASSETFPSFAKIAPVLNRWTALMHQGRFGDYKDLELAAGELRQYKHFNPSLGILAAYAYERTGSISEIDNVAECFARANQPVPFDVAVLATATIRRAEGLPTIEPANSPTVQVAGSFPLMTQGWSYLDSKDEFMRPILFELRRGLLSSLWTTLRAEEGRKLAEALFRGEL